MAAGVCLIHGLRGRALPFTLRCDASCASFRRCLLSGWASLMAQMVKNPSTMQETWVRFLGWEDLLEKGMAIHSSLLAWRIPWTEEPGRPQSMWSQIDTTEQRSMHAHTHGDAVGGVGVQLPSRI